MWGVLTLPMLAYISYDAWQFYIIQNDAPMGIIPDANAIFCVILATATYWILRIAWWVARGLKKQFANKMVEGTAHSSAGSPSPHAGRSTRGDG